MTSRDLMQYVHEVNTSDTPKLRIYVTSFVSAHEPGTRLSYKVSELYSLSSICDYVLRFCRRYAAFVQCIGVCGDAEAPGAEPVSLLIHTRRT